MPVPLRLLAGLACLCTAGLAAAQPQIAVPSPAAIDAAVREVMARYQLPGIAVGVVADGQVLYRGTFGETRVGSGDPITAHTQFKIASNSKAFTAALLARLVQQGRLRWDDPVVRHLPGFAMADPWVTRHITVRDLLVHNSGLAEGGGDLMLWPEPNLFSRADIVRGVRHIPLAYDFRAGYAYDNLLYVVAGEVAATVGGASYETLLRREVFAPLGLDGCRVGAFVLAEAGSVAQPHARRDGRNVPTRPDPAQVPESAAAAAGGIRCDLEAMLAWLRNWLAPEAAQLQWLGPEQRAQLVRAHTPMPVPALRRRWDNTHVLAYGLGFRLADADGQWTVSHTGTLGGMYSMLLMLPDARSGFVFMINGDAGQARSVLGEVLLKLFTAPQRSLGVAGYAAELAQPAATAAPAPARPDIARRVAVTPAQLRPWLGRWRDPWFGEIALCPAGDGVEWRSAKSPRMHGRVGLLDGRYVVKWDDEAVDEDPVLLFERASGRPLLRMQRLDPAGDTSSDYEHLRFVRVGGCR